MPLIFVILLLAFLFVVVLANYFQSSVVVDERPGRSPRPPGSELSILTWNLGYAGLGKDADFIADGGTHLRSANKAQVEVNLAGIRQVLSGFDADLFLIQEVAGPGLLTRGVDVVGGLRQELAGSRSAYSADVKTKFLPPAWSLDHGIATFARVEARPTEIVPLPEEPTRIAWILPRLYHAQVTRLMLGGQPFVVINIHLSAFDERANTRQLQVDAILGFAKAQFDAGAGVVIGGDWNLVLADTTFPHTTEAKYLSWVHPFPMKALPAGWRIAADPTRPTVRTNERSYHAGENYTTIIDGFIVSPNVEVRSVATTSLGFEHSDHQPVLGRFARRGAPK
jgi:endonuclease/exonuclease/phosphatase family metal-dependent hydrolase